MKSFLLIVVSVFLVGCVDLGTVGLHPAVKTAYFSGEVWQVERCLDTEAYRHNLFMEEDEPHSNGSKRYNLSEQGTLVAWLDIAHFSHHQTSVFAYYGQKEAGIEDKLSAMFDACKSDLE